MIWFSEFHHYTTRKKKKKTPQKTRNTQAPWFYMTDFMFVSFVFLLTQAAGVPVGLSCQADPLGQQSTTPKSPSSSANPVIIIPESC